MPRQPAAATLPSGHDDLHSAAREHVDGGRIDVGIEDPLRAASEQGDAGAPFPLGRRHLRPVLCRRNLIRNQIEHRPQTSPGQADAAFSQTIPAMRRNPEPRGKRNRLRGEKAAEFLTPRPLHLRLRERAEGADEIAIGDSTGTGRFARQAAQTTVHMWLYGGQRQSAFEHFLHQHNAPPRRIHLLAQLPIRRASRQAKSAMHARLHRVGHGGTERTERLRGDFVQHQSSREGKRFTGSSALFTAQAIAERGRRPSQSGPSPRKVTPDRPSVRRRSSRSTEWVAEASEMKAKIAGATPRCHWAFLERLYGLPERHHR